MPQPIKRTLNICLSDLPKEKMYRPANGKAYISLTLWGMPHYNHLDQNVEVQVTVSPEDVKNNVPPLVVGGGQINLV